MLFSRMISLPGVLLGVLVGALVGAGLAVPASAGDGLPVEPYADYQGADRCAPGAKPGTVELGRYVVQRYGGGFGGISRACKRDRDVTSEHQEGRAFDWMVDADRPADVRRVDRFFADLLAPDPAGNEAARARRMGVMYLIWDDEIYGAWNEFRPERYLNSGCRTIKRCSQSLRHRNHVHISLTRAAARAETSWFVRRAEARAGH